jgi:hypothetical protein
MQLNEGLPYQIRAISVQTHGTHVTHGKFHLWPSANYASLSTNVAENWNAQQCLLEVFHIEFQQYLQNCIWEMNIYDLI